MFYEQAGERFKELIKTEEGSWMISYEEPGAPFFISLSEKEKLTKIPAPTEHFQKEKQTQGWKNRRELIEPLLGEPAFITDSALRREKVYEIAERKSTTAKRVYRLFYRYLAGKSLMEERKPGVKEQTKEQKDFAWAIETFYFSAKKVSLKTAYDLMLLARYMDADGHLMEQRPSWYSFRHFFYDGKYHRKSKVEIARNGLSEYQRNKRPLYGSAGNWKGNIGAFQMDATQADIYLVSRLNREEVIGRPYVYLAVDTATQLITGIHVGLEVGEQAVISCLVCAAMNKVEFCKNYEIEIEKEDWPNEGLPGQIITDKGREFIGNRMRELAEKFGMEFESLPPFRPDEKGLVEKAFDLIQQKYKPLLRGKGVIEADAQERWATDYRKQAVLTLEEFTQIVIHCVLYLNKSRILEKVSLPGLAPTASNLWNHYLKQNKSEVIPVNAKDLYLLSLPRELVSYSRKGLCYQGLYYVSRRYQKVLEQQHSRKKCRIAYDPANISRIYLIHGTEYLSFELSGNSKGYENATSTELQQEQERIRKERRQWEQDDTEGRIRTVQNIQSIIKQAECKEKGQVNSRTVKANRRRELV